MRLSTLCALLVLAASAPAFADAPAKVDIPAKARALADRGRARHEAGDYPGAIAAFTEAYALAPSPALLFNLAQSYRLGGQCQDASTMYNRFLATDPPAEARSLAETNLIAVDQCVAALRPVPVPPPPIVAAVETRVPAPAPSVGTQREATERDVGVGLGIGGGIALIGALAFEIRAHSISETVSQTYQHGGMGSTIASLDASGRHDAALSDAFGVVGVTAVGAGIAMYWMGSHEAAARHVAIVPTARGAEVHAAWRF